MAIVLVIHGGAGVIPDTYSDEQIQSYKAGLLHTLQAGFSILAGDGTAMDAVVTAVLELEKNPLFNAGKGAVYTEKGTHELDAAVMNGATHDFGAVCTLKHIKHPVLLARAVMEKSPHVFFSGEAAEEFGRKQGLEFVENSYFDETFRYEQFLEAKAADRIALDHNLDMPKRMGTVGAVALDSTGNLAAATSTGGITNKICGRVGDSPIPGGGTYANNQTCAVSCTGYGEEFMKKAVAYDIHARMLYQNLPLVEAARKVVFEYLTPGSGGLIALDHNGNFTMPFNTPGMFRGAQTDKRTPEIAIWK